MVYSLEDNMLFYTLISHRNAPFQEESYRPRKFVVICSIDKAKTLSLCAFGSHRNASFFKQIAYFLISF